MPRYEPVVATDGRTIETVDLAGSVGAGMLAEMPFSLRVLLENLLRNLGRNGIDEEQVRTLVAREIGANISLHIPRVIMPDSSGVPILMDLAAMRAALADEGKDPLLADMRVQADLVVDHSLQVDFSGQHDAIHLNARREFERNHERYVFLKWAQSAFNGLTIHPPGSGIIHQLNLERIAPAVMTETRDGRCLAYPDFVVGGDSHTPMINGLGILGWGVGGIEAEMVLLGQPNVIPVPEVVGVELTGKLRPGVTSTDMALFVTQRLREERLASSFVEYFGDSLALLSVADRATLANMAPEYGATVGYFPIDARSIEYLTLTGRDPDHVALVERQAKVCGLFAEGGERPRFDRVVEIDLSEINAALAGPSRPQDRIALPDVQDDFRNRLATSREEGGYGTPEGASGKWADDHAPGHGAVAIAAITSCTNTANPDAMIRAALVAKRARELGLETKPWVKTSLAPGSRVVVGYLEQLDLMASLEHLGFHVIGFGCTTCGGKSGPLLPVMEDAVEKGELVATSVLSGNRNFSGRIHKLVRANYLGSPALVVAFAIAGRIDVDFESDPLGHDSDGSPVFLRDIWPSDGEVTALVHKAMQKENFDAVYGQNSVESAEWTALEAPSGALYAWDQASSYLLAPPFLELAGHTQDESIAGARVLGLYGDSLTTDHVSPGGEIPEESPAGQYLVSKGIERRNFNSYVGRRGNHEVMARATFANLRIRNRIVSEREGWWTRAWPSGEIVTVHEAAMRYLDAGKPSVIIGGSEYGTGSSRDWAAKGPALLGVAAVVAQSFERIHRSNLVAMGIVPLIFENPDDYERFDGSEIIDIAGLYSSLSSKHAVTVSVRYEGGRDGFSIFVRPDIRSVSEPDYVLAGNVLKFTLDEMADSSIRCRSRH